MPNLYGSTLQEFLKQKKGLKRFHRQEVKDVTIVDTTGVGHGFGSVALNLPSIKITDRSISQILVCVEKKSIPGDSAAWRSFRVGLSGTALINYNDVKYIKNEQGQIIDSKSAVIEISNNTSIDFFATRAQRKYGCEVYPVIIEDSVLWPESTNVSGDFVVLPIDLGNVDLKTRGSSFDINLDLSVNGYWSPTLLTNADKHVRCSIIYVSEENTGEEYLLGYHSTDGLNPDFTEAIEIDTVFVFNYHEEEKAFNDNVSLNVMGSDVQIPIAPIFLYSLLNSNVETVLANASIINIFTSSSPISGDLKYNLTNTSAYRKTIYTSFTEI